MNIRGFLYLSIPMGVLMMMSATGCKPTERNYRAAYELAQNKLGAEKASRAELLSGMTVAGVSSGDLQEVDGVRLEVLGTDTVWTIHKELSDVEAPYYLGFGRIRMKTNAQSFATDLNARAIKSDDSYIIIGHPAYSLQEILALRRDYLHRNSHFTPVGLPGLTIVMTGVPEK